jgi:hypothetical protein
MENPILRTTGQDFFLNGFLCALCVLCVEIFLRSRVLVGCQPWATSLLASLLTRFTICDTAD